MSNVAQWLAAIGKSKRPTEICLMNFNTPQYAVLITLVFWA